MVPPALAELLVGLLKARGSVLVCLQEGADGAPLMSTSVCAASQRTEGEGALSSE